MKLNDKSEIKALREAIEKTLADLGAHHGLTFDVGNARFQPDGSSVEFKLEAAQIGQPEKWEREAARAFLSYARGGSFEGLGTDDLGAKLVTPDGAEWTLIGFKPRCRTAPRLVRRESDGEPYRFSESKVVVGLATAARIRQDAK